MSRLYVLDPAAAADMQEVARYTNKQWGVTQTRAYAAKLNQCMQALASGAGRYKDLREFHPDLRMVRCQHHYIFMLARQGSPAVVLAILHERMDLMERLATRLQD